MPSMAENAEQEVGFAKQEFGSYLGNGASYSETDENLGPLSPIYCRNMARMIENAAQEVRFVKQEVRLYLRNSVIEQNRRKFGPSGLLSEHAYPKCGRKS